MIVNHGGNLRVEYFISYIKLIINARNCTLDQAKEITMSIFFKNNKERYGKETYNRFLDAYKILKE